MSPIASSKPQNSYATAHAALTLDKELVMKVIPIPADCNANSDIFGGWVMAQVNLACNVIPARYAQRRMAAIAVNECTIKQLA